jgi:hypothetical protein
MSKASTRTDAKFRRYREQLIRLSFTIVLDNTGAAKDPVREDCSVVGDSADVELVPGICPNDSLQSNYSTDWDRRSWLDVRQHGFLIQM